MDRLSDELVEDVKVLQRCKAQLADATEKAKQARDAAMRASTDLDEARHRYSEALARIGDHA